MLGLLWSRPRGFRIALLTLTTAGCAEPETCGPSQAVVKRVIDGDTVELESGERVRYLLVDAPETTNGKNACFGAEAREFNRHLVEGRSIELAYESRCRDRYDRLLAYVYVDGIDVNASLVKDGYACVLHIPPDGDARVDAFRGYERDAQASAVGLWSACETKPCGD
jgi:micrococcal nuclease